MRGNMLTVAAVAMAAACCCACRLAANGRPSAPLYRFVRTPDEVTHVSVGAPERDAPRIDPRVFSNFLEHLGGAIYEGLWANCIHNPVYFVDASGAPVRW